MRHTRKRFVFHIVAFHVTSCCTVNQLSV